MIYDDFTRQVEKLLVQIQKDDVGMLVGKEYVGGGGGLLSVDTIHQANLVRLELSKLRQPSHQHIKRGGQYRVVTDAYVQADNWFSVHDGDKSSLDMAKVVVYEALQPEHPGLRFWVRPVQEFRDERRFLKL